MIRRATCETESRGGKEYDKARVILPRNSRVLGNIVAIIYQEEEEQESGPEMGMDVHRLIMPVGK